MAELQLIFLQLRLLLTKRQRVDERLQLAVLGARLRAERRALLLQRRGALRVVLRHARVYGLGDVFFLLVGLRAILRDALVLLANRDQAIQTRDVDGFQRIEK